MLLWVCCWSDNQVTSLFWRLLPLLIAIQCGGMAGRQINETWEIESAVGPSGHFARVPARRWGYQWNGGVLYGAAFGPISVHSASFVTVTSTSG